VPPIRSRSGLTAALLALLAATTPAVADARAGGHHDRRPLVVRGDATAVPAPCGEDGCPVELAGGRFRAAPLGAGAYAGSLTVAGESCQDGAGPLESASFTGLARFAVRRGTGRYARVRGAGLATFTEDAAKHHRMTLVGRLAG
jgi:hypothetical protein